MHFFLGQKSLAIREKELNVLKLHQKSNQKNRVQIVEQKKNQKKTKSNVKKLKGSCEYKESKNTTTTHLCFPQRADAKKMNCPVSSDCSEDEEGKKV